MNINKIKKSITNVPDFPKPGIQFKDITTLLKNQDAFKESIDIFYNTFKDKKIDKIVGIESRGFIFAAPLALKIGCSLVLARKPGKLPKTTISEEYDLEYGTNKIEIHTDSISNGDKVLIVDDLLATGGTANATGSLINKLGGKLVSFAFLIELTDLNGASFLDDNHVFSIIKY
tara:strand:- start:2211 stop:2732 length:522 start_codon:yes stop_codon:yes gene_type:complete